MLENSAALKDLGVLVFSGVGAFFAYRSWRQKNDEIKEKYFERRFAVFVAVTAAVAKGQQRSSEFEWLAPLEEAKQKAEFLFGTDVQKAIEEINLLLIEYGELISSDDVSVRQKAKETRKKIGKKLEEARSIMKRYLAIV